MLLLNINRKLYMGSPLQLMALQHLTFSDLESQGHSYCKALYLVKEHRPHVTIKHEQEPYMGGVQRNRHI